MIERLIVKDFKSHEDSSIEFYPGLNVFLGEVGAGKTSLLEAVSFALFGRYAGNVTQSELIRRGAEKAEVSLVLSTKSGRYKVDRTIYPEKTQEAYFWIFEGDNWNLAVEGATAVSKSIEDLLDVDSSTFLAALYASQGEIKEMLETQPGRRRERLDKLLGIDMYEKIWQKLGEAKNTVLSELTKAQEKASGFAVLESQVRDLRSKVVRNKKELETLEAFSEEIQDRLQPEEEQLETYDDLARKMAEVKPRIEGKNSEIEKASATIESLREKIEKASEAQKVFSERRVYIQLEKELETEKRKIEKAIQRKENLEELLKRDNADLEEAENRRKNLEGRLEKLPAFKEELETLEEQRKDTPELKKQQAELGRRLDETKTDAAKTSNEMENQKRKVERVAELGECPTCLQVVPEKHKEKIKRDTKKRVAKLEADYAVLEGNMREIQGQVEETEKKIEFASVADRKHVEISAQVGMLESRIEEVDEARSRIQEILARMKETRGRISGIKENFETLAEVTAKLMDAALRASMARDAEKRMAAKRDFEMMLYEEEENMKALKLQLEQLQSKEKQLAEEYEQEAHRKVEDDVRVLREDRVKNSEAIERLKTSIGEDESQTIRAEGELQGKRKAWKQVEMLKTENTVLEVLRKSVREVVQPVTRKNNILKVSEAFQTFYQDLSNDNIDYASLDEEGNVEIIRNGEPSPVNSLSGGETTCAALALRLSICSSLTKNQLLLLDEPTIHLDELYRAKLREFLGNHNFEQLIVVTHDNTFDSLPAQIFRVEKTKGESVISPLTIGGGT